MSPNPDARMKVVVGDITTMSVDANVNAANGSLLGGGGADGAIHRAAGPVLLEECRHLGGCPTGQARLTKGYRLPVRHVIYAVGPFDEGGTEGGPEELDSCYVESLNLSEREGVETIAFPAISTGIYGYHKDDAAEVALDADRGWLGEYESPREVIFCCFSESDGWVSRALLGRN